MRIFTFLLVLILSGCTTTEMPPIPATERLKTEALVLGKLISNTSAVGDLVKSFGIIRLENVKTKKEFSLYKSYNKYSSASNASVAGWLPEGNYKVTGLFGYGLHPITASFDANKLGIEFSVKAGQVYDINTLIFQPLGDGKATIVFAPSTPDNYLKIGAMENAYSILAEREINEITFANTFPLKTGKNSTSAGGAGLIVNAFIAAGASEMHGNKKNQWNNTRNSTELISLVKKSTTVLNDKIVFPDGRTIFGSTLGQVLLRNKEGSWTNIDTGSHSEIVSLLHLDREIYASTDNGEFLVTDNTLKSWRKVGTELPYGMVVRMFPLANGRTFLVIKTNEGVEIRTAEKEFSEVSNPIRKFSIGTTGMEHWDLENKKGGQLAVDMNGKIAILKSTQTFVKLVSVLAIYDISDGSWTDVELGYGVAALEGDLNSSIATLLGSSGVFGTTTITSDSGKTFTEVKHPLASRVRFISENTGFALIPNMGLVSSSNHFAVTYDGGKKWAHGKELPEACTDWDLIDKRMICVTRSGAILSTLNAKDITVERVVN